MRRPLRTRDSSAVRETRDTPYDGPRLRNVRRDLVPGTRRGNVGDGLSEDRFCIYKLNSARFLFHARMACGLLSTPSLTIARRI